MIVVVAIAGIILGLIALYLIRPHYLEFAVSSARFFPRPQEGRVDTRLLSLRSLLLSRSFWLQFLALAALLAAVLFPELESGPGYQQERIGIWVALDTSASMSTFEGNLTRMELARREVRMLVAHLSGLQTDLPVCLNLSTFDLAESLKASAATPQQAQSIVDEIEYRPLGTDIGLVRGLIARFPEQDGTSCPSTHLLVITDIPAPVWIGDEVAVDNNVRIIWSDTASLVNNVGIVDIQRMGTVLSAANEIEVELAAYGSIPLETELKVTDVHGNNAASKTINWKQLSHHRLVVPLPGAGQYTLSLSEGGAYSFDDQVTIFNNSTEQIHVDWQLPDQSLVYGLGWVLDDVTPHLRVRQYSAELQDDGVPTLLVGNGYGRNSSPPNVSTEILFFAESPLLDDINFDVAESLNIQGIELPMDNPLQSVLYDKQGLTWFAVSEKLPAAYVPGLPVSNRDENLVAFSTTAFFNALRWLLSEYTPKPLYTLTSPKHPRIEGNRNALHPGEGYTHPPQSYGRIESIEPLHTATETFPLWLALLFLAALFFLIERGLAMFGGARWR